MIILLKQPGIQPVTTRWDGSQEDLLAILNYGNFDTPIRDTKTLHLPLPKSASYTLYYDAQFEPPTGSRPQVKIKDLLNYRRSFLLCKNSSDQSLSPEEVSFLKGFLLGCLGVWA